MVFWGMDGLGCGGILLFGGGRITVWGCWDIFEEAVGREDGDGWWTVDLGLVLWVRWMLFEAVL